MYIQCVQLHTQCEETVHLLKDEEGSVEVVAEGRRSEEITLLVIIHTKFNNSLIVRAAERIVGAQGKYNKWGPYCVRGVWGMPPENFEILHALKCILRASQVPFCACIQYMPTCQLPSLFSGFRLESTTYGALLRRGHIRLY